MSVERAIVTPESHQAMDRVTDRLSGGTMTTVTAPTTTPESIFQLAQGYMASKLLFVAGEIGLFEQLADGPKSAAEVAANLRLPVRSVGVVANAMVAVG